MGNSARLLLFDIMSPKQQHIIHCLHIYGNQVLVAISEYFPYLSMNNYHNWTAAGHYG